MHCTRARYGCMMQISSDGIEAVRDILPISFNRTFVAVYPKYYCVMFSVFTVVDLPGTVREITLSHFVY